MKRITDPIHGSIHLTELEADIVATKAFQRLHNVRQLGLAHYVFPAANYSRFSHSLGACHNAAKMLEAIRRNGDEDARKKVEEYEDDLRLGALLHDLGHYPFSHATEHVVENFYLNGLKAASQTLASHAGSVATAMNHEILGAFILKNDPEINRVLKKHGKTPEQIERIFEKSDPNNTLIEIISSDLDCDRLDYLKRTSHHTGLPYGSVDTDYLTSQATLGTDGVFAYTNRAGRAADHLLVSRYYDYLQVPFNKTVAALEWSLTTVIQELLKENELDCSESHIQHLLHKGKWSSFDDNYFFEKFRKLHKSAKKKTVIYSHTCAILERRPAKTVFQHQRLIDFNNTDLISGMKSKADRIIDTFCSQHDIERERITTWDIAVDFAKYQPSPDEVVGAVRVMKQDSAQSERLCDMPEMLFGQLVKLKHRGFRVFYLPPTRSLSQDTVKIVEQLRNTLALEFSESPNSVLETDGDPI